MSTKLSSFGRIHGLVRGSFGEGSQGMHVPFMYENRGQRRDDQLPISRSYNHEGSRIQIRNVRVSDSRDGGDETDCIFKDPQVIDCTLGTDKYKGDNKKSGPKSSHHGHMDNVNISPNTVLVPTIMNVRGRPICTNCTVCMSSTS